MVYGNLFLGWFSYYIFNTFIRDWLRLACILLTDIPWLFFETICFIGPHVDTLVINNRECRWPYMFIKLFSFFEYILPSAISVCLYLFLRVASRSILWAASRWHPSRARPLAFILLASLEVRLVRRISTWFPEPRKLLNDINRLLPPENYLCWLRFRRFSLLKGLSTILLLIMLF